MTPREIAEELDKFIIGQDSAKRAVAIALRNRWRRMQIEDKALRSEILPKNILMIGPTGVGKTEIARRLAKLANAPFIKVEATKYTEVGYVGREVGSIISDLTNIAVKQLRESEINKVKHLALEAAYERILDVLLPKARKTFDSPDEDENSKNNKTRAVFKRQLESGELDDKEIDIEVSNKPVGVEIMAPPGMEEMTSQLQSMFQNIGTDRKKTRHLPIKKALKIIQEEEAQKLINDEDIKIRALEMVEQHGIVFIDEIDKVCKRGDTSGGDVSREGVQRDLLPLVEGSTISTKYGMIKTDHILFIASGAFHVAKPSDLIAELQGRLPIRVELKALSVEDFKRILTEPDASLTTQYKALMAVEDVDIQFSEDGIERIAEVAWQVNEKTENIGARRLYTVMEKLLETISYECKEPSITIDKNYVDQHLGTLVEDEDLARYIL